MLEIIHERVNVLVSYERNRNQITFYKIKWNGRVYPISKIGYHHKTREGRNIYHIFHVNNDSLSFKLKFDTESLIWWLVEVSDGN